MEKQLLLRLFDETAEESFKPLIGGLGITVKPIAEYDSILKSPYLFNIPPEGHQGNKNIIGKGNYLFQRPILVGMEWQGCWW